MQVELAPDQWFYRVRCAALPPERLVEDGKEEGDAEPVWAQCHQCRTKKVSLQIRLHS